MLEKLACFLYCCGYTVVVFVVFCIASVFTVVGNIFIMIVSFLLEIIVDIVSYAKGCKCFGGKDDVQ